MINTQLDDFGLFFYDSTIYFFCYFYKSKSFVIGIYLGNTLYLCLSQYYITHHYHTASSMDPCILHRCNRSPRLPGQYNYLYSTWSRRYQIKVRNIIILCWTVYFLLLNDTSFFWWNNISWSFRRFDKSVHERILNWLYQMYKIVICNLDTI